MAVKYRWDDFELDLDGFRLERAGVALALEPKAFNLLVLLIERPGHVFTKQEIFDRLWPNTAVTDHALTRVVAQVRRVLGDEARDGRYIATVPTRGYRWLPTVERVAEDVPTHPEPAPYAPEARYAPYAPISVALSLAVIFVLLAVAAWTQRDAMTEGRARSSASRDVAWPVQLTTHPGLDLHPAFSPQGDAIAFASDRSGPFELYVRALTGPAIELPITHDGEQNVQPAWSPDGSLLAYHSHRRGGIWVLPARGGVPRQIVAEGSNPAWSADGGRLAFQSDEPSDVTPSAYGAQSGSTIHIVDADGRNLRQLTTAGQPLGGHAAPAWTHDARFIAFSVFDGARNNGVWVVSVESGAVQQLLGGGRKLYELAFGPDDSSLYVAGGEPVITRIPFNRHSGSAAGQRDLIAVAGAAGVRGVSVSPDGKRLVFAGLSMSSQLWAQPISPDATSRGEPYALTVDTSRRNSLPAISPDGTRVAYVSTRGGEPPNIWVIGIDGRGSAQITDNDGPDARPYWFPDGRRLAFLSARQDGLGLWSVDLDTRREELLIALDNPSAIAQKAVEGPLAETSLSASMDKIVLSIITPPRAHRQLFLSPTAALDFKPLSDASKWIGYPAWSHDEQHLAVEVKDGSSTHAGVIDVRTGALTQLTNERGQMWVRSWSPDNSKIAAAAFRQGRWDLRWLDANTGKSGVITPAGAPNTYVRYPEWSPRGDVVVYERGELRGNVWMLKLSGP